MKLQRHTWWALGALVVAGASGYAAFRVTHVDAADHLDPPARTNPMAGGSDRNADIADIYAWHTGTGASATLTTVLTFSGPNDPVADQAVACDKDVLYVINIDNDGDSVSDIAIDIRFGHDDVGNCFVRVENVPGESSAIVSRVEHATTRGDVHVFAGLRDDPFFFDLTGFQTTLMTGTLSFVNDRDFFANKNSSAVVLEFPLPATLEGGTKLRVWATTARAS